MRKVFLDDLPRRGEKQIDWGNSAGHIVKFIYNNIEGEVEILDYDKKKRLLKIKYNDSKKDMNTSHFTICKLGEILGVKTRVYKNKKISKNKIIINNIHKTDPEFGKWFWNYDDVYKYSYNSDKRVDFRCQNCGEKIKSKMIKSMYNQHFKLNKKLPCPSCSDGVSYPNKLMYNVLKQLEAEFETEYSPVWSVVTGQKNEKLNGRKYYDFSSKGLNFTIEMHGEQHYEESFSRCGTKARTLKEEKENDYLKEKLHVKHSSRYYISIDSRISVLEFIKQNILNSKMAELVDLSKIDWKKANEDSQKSLAIDVWDYWNSGIRSSVKISNLMKLSRPTIVTYLKRGVELNRCDYSAKEELRKSCAKNGKMSGKTLIRLTLDGEYIDKFESTLEANRQTGINPNSIYAACKGRLKTAGGFKWMYKEDYEKYISQQAEQ